MYCIQTPFCKVTFVLWCGQCELLLFLILSDGYTSSVFQFTVNVFLHFGHTFDVHMLAFPVDSTLPLLQIGQVTLYINLDFMIFTSLVSFVCLFCLQIMHKKQMTAHLFQKY